MPLPTTSSRKNFALGGQARASSIGEVANFFFLPRFLPLPSPPVFFPTTILHWKRPGSACYYDALTSSFWPRGEKCIQGFDFIRQRPRSLGIMAELIKGD